jgi:hypothetical protein
MDVCPANKLEPPRLLERFECRQPSGRAYPSSPYYRIKAQAGPVTDKALEEIVFRAAHGVVQSLALYPGELRVAMLPSVVRMLPTTFLEEVAGANS